jgi:hypothetical protein
VALYAAEYARLRSELEHARESSRLPDESSCRDEVNELLVRVRLEGR